MPKTKIRNEKNKKNENKKKKEYSRPERLIEKTNRGVDPYSVTHFEELSNKTKYKRSGKKKKKTSRHRRMRNKRLQINCPPPNMPKSRIFSGGTRRFVPRKDRVIWSLDQHPPKHTRANQREGHHWNSATAHPLDRPLHKTSPRASPYPPSANHLSRIIRGKKPQRVGYRSRKLW